MHLNVRWLSSELHRVATVLEQAAPGPPAISYILYTTKKGIAMSDITIPDTHEPLDAAVQFLDSIGYVTHPDDTPTWSSSDPSVASVVASSDGLTGTVTPGAPGAAVITVDSVNASGEDIKAQGTVTVTAGDAKVGSVTFSTGDVPVPPVPPVTDPDVPVDPSSGNPDGSPDSPPQG